MPLARLHLLFVGWPGRFDSQDDDTVHIIRTAFGRKKKTRTLRHPETLESCMSRGVLKWSTEDTFNNQKYSVLSGMKFTCSSTLDVFRKLLANVEELLLLGPDLMIRGTKNNQRKREYRNGNVSLLPYCIVVVYCS